jgi:hypothetical protein
MPVQQQSTAAGPPERLESALRSVGKILEIHQEMHGRIHLVLIRQQVGF